MVAVDSDVVEGGAGAVTAGCTVTIAGGAGGAVSSSESIALQGIVSERDQRATGAKTKKKKAK